MSLFSFIHPVSIGIDIQPDSIRLIQCKKIHNKLNILNAGMINIPQNVFHEGKILNWDSLQLTLKQFISQYQFYGKSFAGFPAHLVHLKTIQLPADLTECDIETEINLHLQREFPGMLDAITFDFATAPALNTGHMNVYFAATREEYLMKYALCLQSVMQVKNIDIDIYAILRAIKYLLPRQIFTSDTNAILYITTQHALLLVCDAIHLQYHQQWDKPLNHLEHIIQLCFSSLGQFKIKKLMMCGTIEILNSFSENIKEKYIKPEKIEWYTLDLTKKIQITNERYLAEFWENPGQFVLACGLAMKGTMV